MAIRQLTIGMALCALTGTFAAANPVVNGNFATGDLTGWTVTNNDLGQPAAIVVLNGYDYEPCCGASGTPADLARYFASFGPGNVDNSGSLEQTVSLAPGSYVLSYDVGAFGGGTQSLEAQVNGYSANVTAAADNDTDTQLSAYTLDFTSSGAPVTLAFSATSGGVGDNIDVILTNVAIAGVPEPSTWAMMLLGFASLGFAGYRARRSAVKIAA